MERTLRAHEAGGTQAGQTRLKVYQDVLEYFVEAPEVVPYEGSERARDAIIEGMEAAAKILRRWSPGAVRRSRLTMKAVPSACGHAGLAVCRAARSL
jgi:hypothetical protein